MVDIVAAAGSDEPLGPGQYRYVATRAWWMACAGPDGFSRPFACLAENVLQQWVPRHPHQKWLLDRRVTGRGVWRAGTAEEARAEGFDVDHGWPSGRWRAPYGNFCARGARRYQRPHGSWHRPTPQFIRALPRAPRRLYERLRADSPDTRPPLNCARDALRTGMVPAQMRTALYRALLLDADTALEETAENADGRAGIALVAEDSIRSELLIDPATGQCIGERDLLTRADAELGLPAGTVMTTTALSTAVVDTIGALPR